MPDVAPSSQTPAPHRRSLRRLLIYPRFQLLLIGLNFLAIGLSILIFWVSAENALGDLQSAVALSGEESDILQRILQYQTSHFHTIFLATSIIALFSSSFGTLLLSHRIAGPMVRLRAYLRAVRDGANPIPELYFRELDFLSDIPPLVNDAVASLVSRNEEKRKSA